MLAFETCAKVFNALIVSCIFELPTLKVMRIVLQVIKLELMRLFAEMNMCVFGNVQMCNNLSMWISLSKE
jgi:hypothetical protein